MEEQSQQSENKNQEELPKKPAAENSSDMQANTSTTENTSDVKEQAKAEMSQPEKATEAEQNSANEDFGLPLKDSELNQKIKAIKAEIGKKLVGQKNLVDFILVGLLCDGHVLIEGVPGVAKTYTARLISSILNAGFSRIQFTPDLMPSDVTGTNIYNSKTNEFEFKGGPIFSNIVLIDEINRAPAKTQAALFECMEEKQVTVDGTTHILPEPFIVLATQNPVEHEGTYRLPEAQLDRFLFKIEVDYPNIDEEFAILSGSSAGSISKDLSDIKAVLETKELSQFKQEVRAIKIEDKLLKYIAEVIQKTRQNSHLYLGASPRASIGILNASKAMAAIKGRNFVTPDDIRDVTFPVLNHRLVLTPEKEIEGITISEVVQQIIDSVEIPR